MAKIPRKFLVVVNQHNTRDTQIALYADSEHAEEYSWKEFKGEVVAGTFEATTEEEAIQEAAAHIGVSPDVLYAYHLRKY